MTHFSQTVERKACYESCRRRCANCPVSLRGLPRVWPGRHDFNSTRFPINSTDKRSDRTQLGVLVAARLSGRGGSFSYFWDCLGIGVPFASILGNRIADCESSEFNFAGPNRDTERVRVRLLSHNAFCFVDSAFHTCKAVVVCGLVSVIDFVSDFCHDRRDCVEALLSRTGLARRWPFRAVCIFGLDNRCGGHLHRNHDAGIQPGR
jgi:hypothetical protein